MAELKPCPFCGRVPNIEDCGDNLYFVKCKCGIEQSKLYGQRCDAVRHWNRRRGASDDLIKRQDAIRAVAEALSLNRFASFKDLKDFGKFAERMLRNVPSADRPQGEWSCDEYGLYHCSLCGSEATWNYNYCPNCGADMRGEDK